MEQKICQCCTMPMEPSQYGTNKDGSACDEFCTYCYQNGEFSFKGTMEEAIDAWAPHMVGEQFTEEQARDMLRQTLPQLKHWQKA